MNTELSTTTKTNGVAAPQQKAEAYELALMHGDLSKLTIPERLSYYKATCESIGLNPLTKPFDWLLLNGKLTMYSNRNCMDQLRKIHGVSIKLRDKHRDGELYSVTADATDRSNRSDEATGVVVISNLKGADLANAIMKAETKAKNRVTKSICGLGFLDESELDTVKDARRVNVDYDAGPLTGKTIQPDWQITAPDIGGEVAQPPAPEELPIVDISAPRKAVPDPRREPAHIVGGSPATREEFGEASQAQKQPTDKMLWKLFFDLQKAGHEWPRLKKDQQLENIKLAAMAITGDETCSMFTVSKAIEAVAARGILALQDPDGSGEAAMGQESTSFEDDDIPF